MSGRGLKLSRALFSIFSQTENVVVILGCHTSIMGTGKVRFFHVVQEEGKVCSVFLTTSPVHNLIIFSIVTCGFVMMYYDDVALREKSHCKDKVVIHVVLVHSHTS